MEEKHMESLYCLMNINFNILSPLSPFPKYEKSCMISSPPLEIQAPINCVSFFYEYKVMLIVGVV